MLDKLKKHYKNSMTTDLSQQSGYYWFLSDDSEPFGISKPAISESELTLLRSMFNTYENDNSSNVFSAQQLKWRALLFDEKATTEEGFYRFVHFFSKQPITDHASFSEAVNGLFPEDAVLLLNKDLKSGVIIETSKQEFSETPYESLKDMLSTDFYLDISIYIGCYNNQLRRAKETYTREQQQFLEVRNRLMPKSVYTVADIVPYILLQSASPMADQTLTSLVEEWREEDEETLKSIKVFVECNLNVSLAAKQLYIHRNSLQYRVEKFYDKTGIDVKQLKNALTVYLAILLIEQKLPR
ncbi:PucR family transcriptional regulator [Fictibacillus norfolkensis]|uniref:Helix-turn-helix domain-containing protein n=1 Tax=Fictibacillus norfolkensis TaxID=2762233 RepID=A0ABR8SQ44_9BACL|nr:helix-turn-helix domain-containing protein [Fictibacillus norfolkensis]MBD7965494.1 helix-turn-helix domain-containing protein [Fictibacillus norfolkensis]